MKWIFLCVAAVALAGCGSDNDSAEPIVVTPPPVVVDGIPSEATTSVASLMTWAIEKAAVQKEEDEPFDLGESNMALTEADDEDSKV
jgi:hypothetical protein